MIKFKWFTKNKNYNRNYNWCTRKRCCLKIYSSKNIGFAELFMAITIKVLLEKLIIKITKKKLFY